MVADKSIKCKAHIQVKQVKSVSVAGVPAEGTATEGTVQPQQGCILERHASPFRRAFPSRIDFVLHVTVNVGYLGRGGGARKRAPSATCCATEPQQGCKYKSRACMRASGTPWCTPLAHARCSNQSHERVKVYSIPLQGFAAPGSFGRHMLSLAY